MRLKKLRLGINGYDEAVSYFEGCKPWRGKPDDPRPMQERRSRLMSVRREANGDIAFRYHNTDVVVWHKDNTFTITVWPSQSTDVFANSFTPAGFGSGMAADNVRIMTTTGWRIYKAKPVMLFQFDTYSRCMSLLSQPEPFTKYGVNRERMKQVRVESGFADFKAWALAYEAIANPKRPTPYYKLLFRSWTNSTLLTMLANKERWVELTEGFSGVETCLRKVETALKLANDVFDAEHVVFAKSWNELRTIQRSHKMRYA